MKKATQRVGNTRLLKLADFLERLPRKRFDYSTFVGADWKGKLDLSCGTTACAYGWACTMPAFSRLGLKLNPIRSCDDNFYTGINQTLTNEIFALDDDDFNHLFTPRHSETHATPKYVAKKIRKFVKDRQANRGRSSRD